MRIALAGNPNCGKTTLFYHFISQLKKKMTKDDVANVEVGGKVKDKKDPVLPIKQDYSYLWDNSDRVEHNKQHQ